MEQIILRSSRCCKASTSMSTWQTYVRRHISTTNCLHRKRKYYFIKKSPNFMEASRADRYNRSDLQRLFNIGFKKIPFDSKYPVTAKHTGPQNQGGTYEAAKLTAVHAAPVPGYTNPAGKFVKVKELEAELIVPDLTDFELKPYVPYKMTDISEPPLQPVRLYDQLFGQKIRAEVDKELSEYDKKK